MLTAISDGIRILNATPWHHLAARAADTRTHSIADSSATDPMVVSQDISNLLGLKSSSEKSFQTVDPNIPLRDYPFLTMSVDELLQEYVKVALDATQPGRNGRLPRNDRKGDILYAIQLVPGRSSDVQPLRNAFLALDYFFEHFLPLVSAACEASPHRTLSILGASLALAKDAVGLARAVPLQANGEAQFDAALYQPLVDLLPDRDVLVQSAWEWGHSGELEMATRDSKTFFDHWALYSVRRAIPRVEDPIQKAAFKRGEVVIMGEKEQMLMAIRTMPAGRITPDSTRDPVAGLPAPKTFHTVYPERGWHHGLKAVWHQRLNGDMTPVMVAVHDDQHSFSLDRGRNWIPSGAPHSPAIEAMRTEAWKNFLEMITQ